MFINSVLLQGDDVEELFYKMIIAINECSSNQEEYITFQFMNSQEATVKSLEIAFKKLHYNTFLCYHIYSDIDQTKSERWYLKIMWKLPNTERNSIS